MLGSKTAKANILNVLSEKWPLTTKEIYNALKMEHFLNTLTGQSIRPSSIWKRTPL